MFTTLLHTSPEHIEILSLPSAPNTCVMIPAPQMHAGVLADLGCRLHAL